MHCIAEGCGGKNVGDLVKFVVWLDGGWMGGGDNWQPDTVTVHLEGNEFAPHCFFEEMIHKPHVEIDCTFLQ